MAYAALSSLSHTINLIQRYHPDSISPQLETQIEIIHKSVDYLLGFLEDSPDNAKWFEGRIKAAIHEAEDIIESLFSDQICKSSRSKIKHSPNREHKHLEKVIEKIESITEELTGKKQDVDAAIGADKVLDVMSRLCEGPSHLQVIAIVGTGGIGKTTLARIAYDDPLIASHFDIRVWVTVSRDKGLPDILYSILVSIGASDAESVYKKWSVYTALERVRHLLLLERYLVVLDDMWSTEGWDYLKAGFPEFGNGSRIMITTRLSSVASYAGDNSSPVYIDSMNEDQSWSLLRQHVFRGNHCPLNLEYIGRSIARWCSGHPLAVVLVSGILAADLSKDAWENVAENMKSAASAEQLDKILSLSYAQLPHHLRPCFLYMAAFPEDYEISVSKLIKLWVAEGFLELNVSKSLEEIAGECLDELVERNLVLVTKRKSYGRIKCVSVHDLVRDFCIRKAQEEDFLQPVTQFLEEDIKVPRRLLRILDLSNCRPSLPAVIFQLYHLRYLALDGLFNIPAAISNLRNLQTLIITSGIYVNLPVEIWSMAQLRHLLVVNCVLPSQEGGTFALENMQTLCRAVNHICSEEFLKMIPNLKKLGMLFIANGRRFYEEDYQLHNLIHLQTLEDLKIDVCDRSKKQIVSPAFPRTLKVLALSGLRLPWKDMKIVGSLPNLEVLELREDACTGSTWETSEGEFPKLEFLLIEKSYLEHWITGSSHFPRLEFLSIHGCWGLSKIPAGVGGIRTLESIEIKGNIKSSLLESAKSIQEELQSLGMMNIQMQDD